MRRIRQQAARGFTLIELMIVVTIIGVLASVAIPEFQLFVLRSKCSERKMVVVTIKRSIEDWVVLNGGLDPNVAFLAGPPTPALPPQTSKRLPNWNQADWNVVMGVNGERTVEGTLYYSYQYLLTRNADGSLEMDVWAFGDLDGDGVVSTRHAAWALVDGTWSPSPVVEDPPGWLSVDPDDGVF